MQSKATIPTHVPEGVTKFSHAIILWNHEQTNLYSSPAASAATIALPRLSLAEQNDLNPIWPQIEKHHDEAVKRLQEWIKQPSIAAENRGVNEGCELTMRFLRAAG